jgi:hypothetical protein
MPFPKTRKEMEEKGYTRKSYARCRGCGDSMEFWITPTGHNIPMDPMPMEDSPAVSHYVRCPKAQTFRKSKT